MIGTGAESDSSRCVHIQTGHVVLNPFTIGTGEKVDQAFLWHHHTIHIYQVVNAANRVWEFWLNLESVFLL